jgi:two-component system, OmpR family, phosphate regulon sensor histidine kinase PhoR
VAIVEFLSGLSIGLIALWWQRSRSDARLKKALRSFQTSVEPSLASVGQLSLAIAQQQKVHQQLTQQIATYDSVLQSAPVGYLQVDDENRLIWCNRQAKALLGIYQETSPTKPRLLLELVRSYELDDLIEQTRDAAEPRTSSWTFHPVSSDPSQLSEQQPRALQGHGIPLLDHQVGIFLENRQETVRLLQRYDRWVSDLAHELKTPLTSIRLVSETLHSRLDPPLQDWVDRLINETLRLSTLVQDLLDLSRLQRDVLHTLQLKPVDLVDLIAAVWASLEPLARKKELQWNYRGPEHLLLQLDEARIHRLLVNLLDNAIKYSPPQQTIRLEVSIQPPLPNEDPDCEKYVCLDVIDQGPGFAEKDLPYVFDRFYRADRSRTRQKIEFDRVTSVSSVGLSNVVPGNQYGEAQADLPTQGGNGLGLAIVRQIVAAHRGRVSARNHPETGGAWLQVRLPWSSPDQDFKEG